MQYVGDNLELQQMHQSNNTNQWLGTVIMNASEPLNASEPQIIYVINEIMPIIK